MPSCPNTGSYVVSATLLQIAQTSNSIQLMLRLTSFATPGRRQKVRARRRLDGRIDLPNNRQTIVSLPSDQSVFHGEGQQYDRPEAGSR